jgi:hypothetical protein
MENTMRKIMFGLFMLISFSSFGGTLNKVDYKKIKTVVTKESSKAMLKGDFLIQKLDLDDFYQIDITTDILNEKNIVIAKATIFPNEENCDCQDIFEVSMEIEKNGKIWTVRNKTIEIKHILTDQ